MANTMQTKRVIVSSRNGNGFSSGAIIIRCKGNTKEVKAVVFSNSEAKILNSYIDKLKK
jgi:hypothetical protein